MGEREGIFYAHGERGKRKLAAAAQNFFAMPEIPVLATTSVILTAFESEKEKSWS